MKRENFLHFYRDEDESLYIPASSFLGVDANADTSTLEVHFQSPTGDDTDAKVTLGFTGDHKEACEALAGALAGDKLVVTVADAKAGIYLHPFNAIDAVA